MTKEIGFLIFTVALVLTVLFPFSVSAQSKNALVGTWKLIYQLQISPTKARSSRTHTA